MPHHTPLIAMIVMGLVLAFAFGAIANRLRISPLVGYLLAGVLVGPFTPGFVGDQNLANELAEIGVILLMFGVGLHFSLKDLMSVKAIAIPGAVAQIALATILGMGLSWWLGWSIAAGLVFGLALSVASTVVLLRAMQERRLIETERGRIAVGWLIVEDLAMVLALVLLPALAGIMGDGASESGKASMPTQDILMALGLTLGKVVAFVVLMLVVGRRLIPWILHYVVHTGSRELFRLAVLAIALGVAFGAAKLFGVSFALGAFFAGMIMSESALSHEAANETLPLRDAFAVLFFVSVGMLVDPRIIIENPLPVFATLFIIVIGKSLAAFVIVLLFRHPVGTALLISASLAQIGEFSFILVALGTDLKLLPAEGRDLVLAGAILSIMLNPLVFIGADRARPWFERHFDKRRGISSGPTIPTPEASVSAAVPDNEVIPQPTTLTGHVVLVGYGRVGSLVGAALRERGMPFLVIEDVDKRVAELRSQGIEVIAGNATHGGVLAAAKPGEARQLIIAIPNVFEAGVILDLARKANLGLEIIARAHADAEVDHLMTHGATTVIMGEREIARAMIERFPQAPAASVA
ncbi:Kef family K(+) transporter [Ferrovibrio terrae]|uniref:Kef family K(+) transporter n=1 Tax=Ferrovibrio terrae TaxID=2594003 RepID=A0A516H257_9PROT|nr:YbaL family putative K(+) efflux transporter [Ferrovibrio terrae]QDO97856.1 Kef family K(+) transporter [Ferrovibrio terrae]